MIENDMIFIWIYLDCVSL